jgi:hypothetical protein
MVPHVFNDAIVFWVRLEVLTVTLLSYGVWRRVVWYMFTDILEERPASILTA